MGNAINLDSSPKEISAAAKSMYTAPNHMKEHYQRGDLGDRTTKKILEECLQDLLQPIREKRSELLDDKA